MRVGPVFGWQPHTPRSVMKMFVPLLLLVIIVRAFPSTRREDEFLCVMRSRRSCPTILIKREPAGVEGMFSFRFKCHGDFLSVQKSHPRRRSKVSPESDLTTAATATSTNSKELSTTAEPTTTASQVQLNVSWAFTSVEEESRLSDMKVLLHSDIADRASLYPDVYGDFRLLRFLRKDVGQNIKSAAQRYRDFVQWRTHESVDQTIRSLVQTDPFQPPSPRVVSHYLPSDFIVVTNNNNDDASSVGMVVVLSIGSWDIAGITRAMKRGDLTMNDFVNYWVYMYESIHATLYQQSIHRERMMYTDEVIDLTGSKSRQLLSTYFLTKVVPSWVSLTQANYPETTRQIHVLNPPPLLNVAWNMITPFLSKGTLQKFQFHRNYQGTARDFLRRRYNVVPTDSKRSTLHV